jgi:hypothetical protein
LLSSDQKLEIKIDRSIVIEILLLEVSITILYVTKRKKTSLNFLAKTRCFKFDWNFIFPKTICDLAEERFNTSIHTIELSLYLGKLSVTYGLTRRRQWLNYRVFPGQGHGGAQIQADGQQQDYQHGCGPHNAPSL